MIDSKHITKILHTETGHRLTTYPHRCAHFHGHSFKWEVTVTAQKLDDVGFIMDYKDLKEITNIVVDPLDHAFIMHDQDPLVLAGYEGGVPKLLRATNGEDARLFIVPFNPTSENIVEWVAEGIKQLLPEGVQLSQLRLWETASSYCDYVNLETL